MKSPSVGQLGFGVIALAALPLTIVGAPRDRPVPATVETRSPPPLPASVSGQGFTLTSPAIDLPGDDAAFPDGPNADLVNANCTACHSASMALTQPRFTAEKWQATVTKMREVYHAPVAEADVPAIVTYLAAMPGQSGEITAPGATVRVATADQAPLGGPGR